MKIEQVNKNQIRCTLTREDLEERKIKFSELTYGSEKANRLFRDMMQEAHFRFGFEPDDTPLMIEAVPMQSGMIVFVITKVEAPDELESHLAQFASAFSGSLVSEDDADTEFELADTDTNDSGNNISIQITGSADPGAAIPSVGKTLRDLFQMFTRTGSGSASLKQDAKKQVDERPENRLFCFSDLGAAIDAAAAVKGFDMGESTLYKNTTDGKYYLLLYADYLTPNGFKQLCTLMADFCENTQYSRRMEAYMEEHYDIVIAEQALQALSQVG